MKKYFFAVFTLFSFCFLFFFTACKKINEATEIGDDLIPSVDNVTTFEAILPAETNNSLLTDSTKLAFDDEVALGTVSNDPVFGSTNASVFFNISHTSPGTYPFFNRDSMLAIDSVVLSLSYTGTQGDTNSLQTVRVYEISQASSFSDTALYRFDEPEFATTGMELGAKTFAARDLNDSLQVIRKDTTRIANVLRIKLNNSLGNRLASYDTTNTANGAYRSDSTFKALFRGFALKTDVGSGNALHYFSLNDRVKTKLIVYYKVNRNGIRDTASAEFSHLTNGQANLIKRTPGGDFSTYLANGTNADDKLFIQSSPGSFASIRIPALDTFSNSIIHRAELIATRLPSAMENLFAPPNRLILDKVNIARDTAFALQKDFFDASGNVSSLFGGTFRSDNTYRFNISRHVQDIVTRRERNQVLRLYAPLRTSLFLTNPAGKLTFPVINRVANGRVVLAGGNFADPSSRLRVRIVYSKI